jgi:hypothetical protein
MDSTKSDETSADDDNLNSDSFNLADENLLIQLQKNDQEFENKNEEIKVNFKANIWLHLYERRCFLIKNFHLNIFLFYCISTGRLLMKIYYVWDYIRLSVNSYVLASSIFVFD